MSFIHDDVLDGAVGYIDDNCDYLYICSAEPADYTEASSTYDLGYKASPTIDAPEDGDASGRKVHIQAIADGTVSDTGTATHWALVDEGNTKLLAAGSLSSGQSVTNGNTFTLTAFDVELPDPS